MAKDDYPEGGLRHRLCIVRGDIRWFSKRKRFVALARVLWLVLIQRHYGETCEVCGRRYMLWCAPSWMYNEVHGNLSGSMCPACFDRSARKLYGSSLTWVPGKLTHNDIGRLLDQKEESNG